VTKALPEQTFTITYEGGLFLLRDGRGKDFACGKNVRLLEKEAWNHGASILHHDYNLKLAEP
jgi:hypothetical protein